MAGADAALAMVAYLKTTSVGTVTSDRVYRPTIDDPDVVALMPQASVVVRRAGGYGMFGGALIPVGDPRMDFYCYGESAQDAEDTATEVTLALKALRTSTFASTRLMGARIEGGAGPGIDPDTNWPCVVLTAQVVHCELAVT